VEQLVELLAVPPAVHIGLAQPERALGEHTGVEALVVHLDVERAFAVEAHTGMVEQPLRLAAQTVPRIASAAYLGIHDQLRWSSAG